MGRGRAKAKQQKVARELKYNTQFTDLDALQRELGTSTPHGGNRNGVPSDVSSDADPNAEDDDYDDWTGTDR